MLSGVIVRVWFVGGCGDARCRRRGPGGRAGQRAESWIGGRMLSNSQSTSRVMSLRARECGAVGTRFGMGGSGMPGGAAVPVAVFLPAASVVPGVDLVASGASRARARRARGRRRTARSSSAAFVTSRGQGRARASGGVTAVLGRWTPAERAAGGQGLVAGGSVARPVSAAPLGSEPPGAGVRRSWRSRSCCGSNCALI